MKRIISVLLLVFILISASMPLLAFAAGTDNAPDAPAPAGKPSNVTITVVMPAPEPTPAAVAEPANPVIVKVYPVDVSETRENGGWQIVKTYELGANEKPEDIPRDSFVRDNRTYTLTDITRRETATADTRERTETVTVTTDTKELESILPLLAPTMDYTDDNGFIGVLTLDVASIKVEEAGTTTSGFTMTTTREYPRLSSADTSLLPKTVTERGSTYLLASVDWKAGNTVAVDYNALPEYYTAVATYTTSGYKTSVTGYNTTAEYKGTLAKLSQGKTIYTAYFSGAEILPERIPLEIIDESAEQPAELSEQSSVATDDDATQTAVTERDTAVENNGNGGAWLILMPFLGIACGIASYYLKNKYAKKEKITNEKTDKPAVSVDADGGDKRDA
ncbi:MAG: hypothetical protein LBN43_02650 [Oscillospiraceae bacterium]|jgi:hypothetical protein|nr:hypothetical protein [Oscillospiraceae bacterium]